VEDGGIVPITRYANVEGFIKSMEGAYRTSRLDGRRGLR